VKLGFVKINFVLSGDPRQFTWDESGIFEVSSPPEKPQRVGNFQMEPRAKELIDIRARLNPCLSTSVFIKMETITLKDKYSKIFHYDSEYGYSLALCSNGSFVSSLGTDSDSESEFMTIGFYIFIGMICFVVALTIGGLVYMCKTNCHCQVQCCKDLEKEDKNLDYGTYYYDDGERRTDVMEVSDQNPEYGF